MLFRNTFYINALKFLKNVFSIILKIAIVTFSLTNALINVFFILSSFDLIIIRFFTCFYLRFTLNPSRYLFSSLLLILLSSLLSYFSRFLITILIVIYLRFLNAF